MIKSLNYLNNIMAKMEAQQHGFHECLMLNEQGYVAECSGDNVFLIHKGRLITPASHAGALVGITRQVALEIAAALKIPTVETNITRYDVWNADECFLSGTAAEVIPVIEVDARKIGTGKPGEFTSKFLAAFHELAMSTGTPFNSHSANLNPGLYVSRSSNFTVNPLAFNWADSGFIASLIFSKSSSLR